MEVTESVLKNLLDEIESTASQLNDVQKTVERLLNYCLADNYDKYCNEETF